MCVLSFLNVIFALGTFERTFPTANHLKPVNFQLFISIYIYEKVAKLFRLNLPKYIFPAQHYFFTLFN